MMIDDPIYARQASNILGLGIKYYNIGWYITFSKDRKQISIDNALNFDSDIGKIGKFKYVGPYKP